MSFLLCLFSLQVVAESVAAMCAACGAISGNQLYNDVRCQWRYKTQVQCMCLDWSLATCSCLIYFFSFFLYLLSSYSFALLSSHLFVCYAFYYYFSCFGLLVIFLCSFLRCCSLCRIWENSLMVMVMAHCVHGAYWGIRIIQVMPGLKKLRCLDAEKTRRDRRLVMFRVDSLAELILLHCFECIDWFIVFSGEINAAS
jgi:hypothetical protein